MGSRIIEYLQGIDHSLKVLEVDVLLSVDQSTVYRKVRSGSLPGFGVGSSVRIDPGELIDYLEKKTRLGARAKKPQVN
jgi:excisionase family DNA binding protein